MPLTKTQHIKKVRSDVYLRQHKQQEKQMQRAIRGFLLNQIRMVSTHIRNADNLITPESLPVIYDSNEFHALFLRVVRRYIARGMIIGAMTEWTLFREFNNVPLDDILSNIASGNEKEANVTVPVSQNSFTVGQIMDVFTTTWKLQAAKTLGKVKSPLDAEMPRQIQQAIIQSLTATFLQPYWFGIEETTKGRIAAVLERGAMGRWTRQEVVENLNKTLGGKKASSRALSIARTEMTNAFNAGHMAAIGVLEQAGYVNGREWVAVSDEATRFNHAFASGQVVSGREMFVVGGHTCRYPADYALPPEERCYCRCTVTSVTQPT
jgi:uncharacterized protein (DUF2062 family)